MKKSILALLLAGMLFFTACGGGKEDESSQVEETSGVIVTDGVPMVVQMFGQEATHIKMRMYGVAEGVEETVDITLAIRGSEYVYFMEYEGMQVRMILKNDTLYIVSDNEKLAMNVSALGIPMNITDNAVPVFTGGMYNAKGTGEVRGETLPYFEYNVDNASVRYYVSGDNIKYITFTQGAEEVVMEILEFSTNIDDSLFDIPADYTVIESMTDFMNLAE